MTESEQELQRLLEESVTLSREMLLASDRKQRELGSLQGERDDLLRALKRIKGQWRGVPPCTVCRRHCDLAQGAIERAEK